MAVAMKEAAFGRDQGNAHLMERIALALNSTLELHDVLHLLAQLTLEATGGDRCSVLLVDGDQLRPTVALAADADDDLWTVFRGLEAFDIDDSNRHFLSNGRAVAVEDALASEIIPRLWAERFDLRAVVIVPLSASGEPCGLMAVDWAAPRSFTADEVRLLETIGSYAGVAVNNARLFEAVRRRAELQEGLAHAAAVLAGPLETRSIADGLVGAYSELLDARLCAIALWDAERSRITTVGSRGARPSVGHIAVDEVPERIVSRLRDEWASERVPLEFADDPWFADVVGGSRSGAAWYLLIPLLADNGSRGAVLLGFAADTRLDAEERSAAVAMAAIATAAFERTVLLERLDRQVRQLDALYKATAALTESANAATLVNQLNELLTGHGVEVVSISFRDRRLAQHLGGDDAEPEERAAWKAGTGVVELSDGTLAVQMRLGRRVVGSLRVRPADIDAEERSLLEALARGLADVASRSALRAAVEDAARERAVVAERDRIAADLHDTVGQIFVAIGLLARREAEELPSGSPWAERTLRLAELADRGKWEIQQTVQALAFVPGSRRGLTSSLKVLARSIASDSGIEILVDVSGRPARLSPRVERALYRVTHEALTNAWRHARCALIRVELSFSSDEVVLSIVDDGVGIALRHPQDGPHVGIAGMRRVMNEAGGSLKVRNARPRGVQVEARIAREHR